MIKKIMFLTMVLTLSLVAVVNINAQDLGGFLNNDDIGIVTDGNDVAVDAGGTTVVKDGDNVAVNAGGTGVIVDENGVTVYTAGAVIAVKNTTSEMYLNLKGKILLKVEGNGEAFYLNPIKSSLHYLGKPDDAFSVMRDQGIGITTKDLEKIEVGYVGVHGLDSDGDGLSDLIEDAIGTNKNNRDTDGDTFSDKDEIMGQFNPLGAGKLTFDVNFSVNQNGKIFLQIEDNGEAWYINPSDEKRYFLGRPDDAFAIMRALGLGITNANFDNI